MSPNLRPVPPQQPPAVEPEQAPSAAPTWTAFALLTEYIRRLELDNAKLLRAVQRESHHLDVRAQNTDRPTRERLTNGAPAIRR